MHVNLVNSATNQVKQTKVGYSWTTLFFSFWPALFRGDWLWFFVQLAIGLFAGFSTFGVGFGISTIVFSFIYNKIYINELLTKGFQAADKSDHDILLSHGFIVDNMNHTAPTH
ncbi:DUF2628 domain-containing protein [Lentilactobacillus sp. Marseille-Q4993]|uniref:DUF2628 domain-containing protein n=1 Tax=Lentilactobacillus sp. Marseille-Q4993 TaxID=3039492 RepID=UPI0024BCFFF5|nr:DUF2628 domain-containing protein [Lentilactobacillus sp. Marseille-Q4993]